MSVHASPTLPCPRCGGPASGASCSACSATGPWNSKALVAGAIVVAALLLLVYLVVWVSVLERIRNERRAASQSQVWHGSSVVPPEKLAGKGRIYLVQMGPHKAPYDLPEFAVWLRNKYGLDVDTLPMTALDPAAFDSSRNQYVADLLSIQLRREHPDLAANPDSYLIGFTDADMYLARYKWNGGFTLRDGPRTAIISSDGQQNSDWNSFGVDSQVSEAIFQKRLKRILLKDVAILYWHLPLNNDPASLLQERLNPDIPVEDIYESDLKPEQTNWGRYESEPCFFLEYSAKNGIRAVPGEVIQDCDEPAKDLHDETAELFKVDLQEGELTDLHTDFNLPDGIPIQFQRETRSDWTMPMAFGVSGSDNYDSYLTSKDMRSITLRDGDYDYTLDRTPKWLSVLPLVKYVDADFSGRYYTLRWHTTPFEHFELKRFDGETQQFLPCDNTVLCYLIGKRDPQEQELKFQRDDHRRLTTLTSPNRRSLSLAYGPGSRISQITDDQNRKVFYGYNDRGQLVRVAYPTGEVLTYTYDHAQHLLTFSASPNTDSPATVMLRNEYAEGRLLKQTLANGKVYTYSYEEGSSGKVTQTFVTTPEGTRAEVLYMRAGAAIRLESAGSK